MSKRIPRWCHELYARSLGYFWLPCPRCGRMFGGHEADGDPLEVWTFGETGFYRQRWSACCKEPKL